MFAVRQLRQALQQLVATGVASAIRPTSGSVRAVARSSIGSAYLRYLVFAVKLLLAD